MPRARPAASIAHVPNVNLEQPVLRAVAAFLDAVRDDGLPPAVARQGGRLTLDTVGCMIAGATASPSVPMVETFGRWAGAGRCDIIGTDLRTSPLDAAFVNAYTADVLDFEETLVSHPSAVVLSAGLAVGQDIGASGDQVITAVMVGYEVGSRLGSAMMPSPELTREVAAEFWWKSVAAAITAGMLLGTRGEAWADTIGYAASATPAARRGGFEFRPMSHLKANYQGQAHTGVVAAYLSSAGFRTYRGMLDGERTFAQLLGSDRWRPELLLDGLGESWVAERIGFKIYPTCLYLHPLLECITQVRADPRYRADRIRRVRASVPALIHDELGERRPVNVIDAQFSAPFTAANLLLSDELGPDWLDDERIRDSATLELAGRIEVAEHAPFTAQHQADRRIRSAILVELDDGTELTAEVGTIRGHADRPLTDEELADKFVLCAAGRLAPAAAREAAAGLLQIADAAQVDDVVALVR